MTPTLTDDALVRDLRERADAALPPMGLRPDAVLAAGRRRKHRVTAAQSASTVVAVAAIAVGVAYGLPGETQPTPLTGAEPDPGFGDGQTIEIATGVIAVNRPVERTLDDGTAVLDLGISFLADQATSRPLVLAPITDEQLAEANASGAQPAWDGGVQISEVGESSLEGLVTPFLWSSGAALGDDDYRWDTVLRTGGEESGLFVGVVPAWLPDPRVVLYSTDGFRQVDGGVVHGLEVPVYPAPTDDGRLLYTVWIPAVADDLDGVVTDVTASLAIGSDGAVVPGQRCADLSLDECAADFGAGVYEAAALAGAAADAAVEGLGTLTIDMATDVASVETPDGGLIVDPEVQVGGDPLDQDLRYALRWGGLSDEVGGIPDRPTLWVETTAPDGTAVMRAGGGVEEALDPDNRNPVAMTKLGDHEAYVVGIQPPALKGATFELVVALGDREVTTPIPTFRVPGLGVDAFFIALTDPEVDYRDWPTVMIVVTATDGTTSRWGLDARELTEAAPTPEGSSNP